MSNTINFNTAKFEKLGYKAAVGLSILFVAIAASPFLFSSDLWQTLFRPLYGDLYLDTQLPKQEDYQVSDFLHRMSGMIYLVLGLLNFNAAFRNKYMKLHRVLGKAFVTLSILLGATGIIMSFVMPFVPVGETIVMTTFGSLMILSAYKGYATIRKGNVEAHKKWMARCFSIGLGGATMRGMYTVGLYLLPGELLTTWFVATLWASWIIHIAVVEWFYYKKGKQQMGERPSILLPSRHSEAA